VRIALISTVEGPVRQHGSGSIETLVWLLTRELNRLGHDVTVFGVAGSEPCGELVATIPSGSSPYDWQVREWINLCRAVEQSEKFDVLHSHGYFWGFPLEPLARAPMVHTLHVWPDRDAAYLWSLVPGACVTAISSCQWKKYPHLTPAATVHHGLDASQFTFRNEPEDYLLFLGQFSWGKGPTVAIETARALGMRLRLAGPTNDYYREHVEPLVDGYRVEYVGYVSGPERDRLLGGARALLYPVQAPEPFGLVVVEAMLCGTPVAAMRLGAAPEIVDEGVTGFCAGSTDELVQAAREAVSLDRRRVRTHAEGRFSAERMAREYVRVYEELLSKRAAGIDAR